MQRAAPSKYNPTFWWKRSANCIQLALSTYVEPVDGAAVNERRILADVVAERISNRTEGDDDVQVLATSTDEKCKQLKRRQFGAVSSVLVSRCPDRLRQLTHKDDAIELLSDRDHSLFEVACRP